MKPLHDFLNESKVEFKIGDLVKSKASKSKKAKVVKVETMPGMKINGKAGDSFEMIHIEWQDSKRGLMTWAGRPESFTKV
tara:strand:+ start:17543 stop:17782 length:240 start_codon:yes stop_codon:yes gene_type:complete